MNFDKKLSFPEIEKVVLDYWKKENIFEKQNEQIKNSEMFKFYDGPPFATGLPHYGHLLAGTIKDVVCRYKISKGFNVERRFGWDCHGLPIETEAQKYLGLNGSLDILNYGVYKFNEVCRQMVLKYANEWENTVERSGRWVDFKNTYKTMDSDFMESVWWIFSELYKKNLIYKGLRVCAISPKLQTPLSNFEVNQGFKMVDEQSVYVKFKLVSGENILVWTTTSWSLFSNVAIAVNENLEYLKVKFSEEIYYISKDLVNNCFSEYEILEIISGKDLIGKEYKSLFSYIPKENNFKIVSSNHVRNDSGTGFVHIAPCFGEDDFRIGKENNLSFFDPTNLSCCFENISEKYNGRFVKECDKDIIKELKEMNSLFKTQSIKHQYPFCYRTGEPLIYKAVSTWFLSLDSDVNGKTVKEWLNVNNEEINWTPNHVKNGRFGNWIKNSKDWNISRNRFWGTPIPIWEAEDGEILVISSKNELEELSGKEINDLHPHIIDSIEISKNGKIFKRIPEIFDCWFESGSMPYAQKHFPFSDIKLDEIFPGDFIAEGLDQTRGWFYTLNVLSNALFQKPAFKNVVVNGIVLAEDGKKMSKKDKNYPDPNAIFETIGADAIRIYLLNSGASKADEVKFSEKDAKEVVKTILLPIFNSLSFYDTYLNLEIKKDLIEKEYKETFDNLNYIDSWMISETNNLIKNVEENLESFDFQKAISSIESYVDVLTNVYIRCNRERFWENLYSEDKQNAYNVLKYSLVNVSKILSPFAPFFSDYIHLTLTKESVHLKHFPETNNVDLNKISQMKLFKNIVSLGRVVRSKSNIKLRQPLNSLTVTCEFLDDEIKDLLKNELNVKEIVVENDLFKYNAFSIKPNYKTLKEIYPNKLSEFKTINFSNEDIVKIISGETIVKNEMNLNKNLLLVESKSSINNSISEGTLTVFFDENITEELKNEMIYNEIKSVIQKYRKDKNYNISDIVSLDLNLPKTFSFIKKELLEKDTLTKITLKETYEEMFEIESEKIYLGRS